MVEMILMRFFLPVIRSLYCWDHTEKILVCQVQIISIVNPNVVAPIKPAESRMTQIFDMLFTQRQGKYKVRYTALTLMPSQQISSKEDCRCKTYQGQCKEHEY